MINERRVLILEHLDPEHIVPSGIDNVVIEFIKHDPTTEFSIVGITHHPGVKLGVWRHVDLGGRRVRYLPVACFDRNRKGLKLRIPHSLRFLLGVWRHRNLVGQSMIHAHRVETGCFSSVVFPQDYIQFVHNDSKGLLGSHSDSMWRYLGWLYRIVERRAAGRAIVVAIFNKRDAPRLENLSRRLVVAETWYDPILFNPDGRSSSSTRVLVSWVGRLDHQKDPWLLISTAEEAQRQDLDWVFTVVGAGPLEADIERYVAARDLRNVHIKGAVEHDDIASILRESTILLMTSHYEGSPTVLIEALACGLPVVVTAGSDTDGLVSDGENGWVVQERSARTLVAALGRCADMGILTVTEAIRSRAADRMVPSLARLGHLPPDGCTR